MATVRYTIRGTGEFKTISIHLNYGKQKIRKSLGIKIKEDSWNKKTNLPKHTTKELLELSNYLSDLSNYIFNESKTARVSKEWLEVTLNQYQEKDKKEVVLFRNLYKNYIEAKQEECEKNKSIKKQSVNKYLYVYNDIIAFESFQKRKYEIKEITEKWGLSFTDFLIKERRLKINTVGRKIRIIKTILNYAQKIGLETSKDYKDIKELKEKITKHTLSFEELDEIKNAEMPRETLKHVRDWLVIGCYTGQRVSDLLRMNKKMIKRVGEFEYIFLRQVKTGKDVQIPLHKEVKTILDSYWGEFPPKLGKTPDSSSTLFNRAIKEVCKIAGIDEEIEDYLFNPKIKRKEMSVAPKYQFITSHACRRSFATNFYAKIPTPLLMNITAHSTEKMFLEYIGAVSHQFSEELAKMWK